MSALPRHRNRTMNETMITEQTGESRHFYAAVDGAVKPVTVYRNHDSPEFWWCPELFRVLSEKDQLFTTEQKAHEAAVKQATNKADAALIVRAVNSHAQLVAALETLVNIVGTVAPTHRSALLAGESALAAAKGDK